MNYYVTIKTLREGQLLPMAIRVVPTGKVQGDKAEGICITPGASIEKVWFTREEII